MSTDTIRALRVLSDLKAVCYHQSLRLVSRPSSCLFGTFVLNSIFEVYFLVILLNLYISEGNVVRFTAFMVLVKLVPTLKIPIARY